MIMTGVSCKEVWFLSLAPHDHDRGVMQGGLVPVSHPLTVGRCLQHSGNPLTLSLLPSPLATDRAENG